MSRKTKETLYKERLGEISNCPLELLDKIVPSEETFAKIQAADRGDVSAIRDLSDLTYQTYKNECEINPATLYFASLGMAANDRACAVNLLKCVERFNAGYDLADEAIRVLEVGDADGETGRLISRVRVQRFISELGPKADYDAIEKTLRNLSNEYSAYTRLYLASRRLIDMGSYDKADIEALSTALGVPSLVTLPVFTGRCEVENVTTPSNFEGELEVMRFVSALVHMDEWRDFWLKAIYEYATIYLGGDISTVAEDILNLIAMRCDYPEKKLHLLAIKRILSRVDAGEDAEYESLKNECIFDGYDPESCEGDALNEAIKDAVYVNSAEKKRELALAIKRGTEIKHVKNRYLLEATMNNHIKRGIRHLWDATLSIKTELDTPPTVTICKITDTKNEVIRNGVALDKERKLTQVFCRGELQLGERAHPFELDLILDISYVSSTKCELAEIKIKEYHREGEYLVFNSTVSIY